MISRYENHEMTLEGGYLTIRICVDEEKVNAQPSKSGKTLVLATTGGATRVNGSALRVNLTVYRSP